MTPPARPAFDSWMNTVDREIQNRAGLSVHDLADQPFRDWYDDGMWPEDAAEETLEAEGFYAMFDEA